MPQTGIPEADPNVTPTGSHIKGAPPDPFTLRSTPYDFNRAPTNQTADGLYYSSAWPYLNFTGHP